MLPINWNYNYMLYMYFYTEFGQFIIVLQVLKTSFKLSQLDISVG